MSLLGLTQTGKALNQTLPTLLDKKINEAIAELICEPPTEQDPVSLNATVVSTGDSLAVILKARMAPGWHIYQLVPPHMPYVAADPIFSLPGEVEVPDKWQTSDPIPSPTDRGVLIHEDEAWFVLKMPVLNQFDGPLDAKTGLYYQTCDHRQCLPPVEKTIDIKLKP